jgi:hypothetical protein
VYFVEYFGKFEGMQAVLMRHYKEKTIETEVKKEEGQSENGSAPAKVEPKIVFVRKFKGSIFVVFKTPEQAQKVLEEEITHLGTPIVSSVRSFFCWSLVLSIVIPSGWLMLILMGV